MTPLPRAILSHRFGTSGLMKLLLARSYSHSDSKALFSYKWRNKISNHIYVLSPCLEQFQSWISLLPSAIIQVVLSEYPCDHEIELWICQVDLQYLLASAPHRDGLWTYTKTSSRSSRESKLVSIQSWIFKESIWVENRPRRIDFFVPC